MSWQLRHVATLFGTQSTYAQTLIPRLYAAIPHDLEAFQAWQSRFPTTHKALKLASLAGQYALDCQAPAQLIFALQTYYALVIKLIAAQRLHPLTQIRTVESGEHFVHGGITHFTENDLYAWYLPHVDVSDLLMAMDKLCFDDPPPDALKALYHDLFPPHLRHALGEYYTPDWLAHFILQQLDIQATDRVLDPTCGSGTFLVLLYRHWQRLGVTAPLSQMAGIDINPLACLAAKANLILNSAPPLKQTTLPIYCADTLLAPPHLQKFDMIVGNPPWVNWQTLAPDYRQQTKALWTDYGLFPHVGFDSILGKGKKDLSLLLTYVVVARYLKEGGRLAFVMSQAVLKAGGAAEAFRQFNFSNPSLAPYHVDDFSQMRIFSGAETKPIVLYLASQPDSAARINYHIWQAPTARVAHDAPLSVIEDFTCQTAITEPIAGKGSAWLTGQAPAIAAVRKLVGKSVYDAHAGAYSGGANAVYWLDVLAYEEDRCLVRNITAGAKRAVPQVERWLETRFIYPLLRGRDVKRWQAVPSVHMLIVQDPQTRQGYAIDWLAQHYPLTYAYLKEFEPILRQRATFKRYFRRDVPFYTMFDIGHYSFCRYKVVWHGFGKRRMAAAVVGTIDQKAIMSNQAMHPFIGLNDEDEAHYLAACLNSIPFEFAVLSHTQRGGKSFAQPGLLKTLRLVRYNSDDDRHRALADASRQAHQGSIDDDYIAHLAAQVWQLTGAELTAVMTHFKALIGNSRRRI